MLEKATQRFPELAEAGIQLFFNGPESFTVDDRYLLGETPEVRNLFVACGFNSIGISLLAALARCWPNGCATASPPWILWDVDVRRTFAFQTEPEFLRQRTEETLGLLRMPCTGPINNTPPAAMRALVPCTKRCCSSEQ